MDNLNDLLEEHISQKDRLFVAFGIGSYNRGDDNNDKEWGNEQNEVSGEARTWCNISVFVDDVIDENKARETIQHLENDINKHLTQEHRRG
ncbi:uncharacterized protein F4822DRAFT_396172 [Hypoxylon trugodes]|uniref:uncharacterized protein n=1 Tax=Hypoxylon trugodes TaxID=326681 RepID=UPI00219E755B|nr:uncharacterized protein F4822DRAFT_396172 [Hypoxylon trugodes]KAI1391266.1 hypothetical protein F4822DRAFT_396172 [Hypoxylon trugodes]